jgi:drug/metabolite transporter (DMT)-like permease
MRPEVLWIIATAGTWGAYPLVLRSAGQTGSRGTLVLMLVGLVPIAVAALSGDGVWPGRAAVVRLVIAGVMMGCGLLAFHALASSELDASVTIPIVDTAMLLVSAVGAIIVFSEPVTVSKVAGIAMLLGGIALLRPG